MQLDAATLSALVAVAAVLLNAGVLVQMTRSNSAAIEAMKKRQDDRETAMIAMMTALETKFDSKVNAVGSQVNSAHSRLDDHLRENASYRERVAQTYITRDVMTQIEMRLESRLEKITDLLTKRIMDKPIAD